MTKDKLHDLLKSKKYEEILIQWIEKFYPFMTHYIGVDNIDKVLQEWTINISSSKLNEKGSTGICERDKKSITGLWYGNGNKELSASLLLHEVGHAAGYLDGPKDTFLSDGEEVRESFFRKLEEAIVSEAENKIKYGEFNYEYYGLFDYDTQSCIGDFKSPSNKYIVEFACLQNLKLLLGNKSYLIHENMYSDSYEQKCELYEDARDTLKRGLTKEQFKILTNSLNVLVLNSAYSKQVLTKTMGQIKITMYEQNKEEYSNFEEYEKDFDEWISKNYPLSYRYAKENDLLFKSNLEAVDDLCDMTIDVLLDRLDNPNYNQFECLKEISQYFVRLDNKSERLENKTRQLRDRFREKISEINIDCDALSSEDKQEFLMYILSLDEVSLEEIKQLKVIEITDDNVASPKNTNQKKMFFSIGNLGIFSVSQPIIIEQKESISIGNYFSIGGNDDSTEKEEKKLTICREGFQIQLPDGKSIYNFIDTEKNRQDIACKIMQADIAISFSDKFSKMQMSNPKDKTTTRDVVRSFARDKDVALKKEGVQVVFKQLEMEKVNELQRPTLLE